jgi:hypothetical protein
MGKRDEIEAHGGASMMTIRSARVIRAASPPARVTKNASRRRGPERSRGRHHCQMVQ